MDVNDLIDEPNKVAELYRNYRPVVVPFEVEPRLDFIDINEDGFTILGSSNLSGRYWRGSVWYYKNSLFTPTKENSITGIECKTSVSDGKFISKEQIIIGEDSGAVTIYGLKKDEEPVEFERLNSRHDHDNSVSTISISTDGTSVITGGMDLCIKVWDIQELMPTFTFPCAHSHYVTSLSYSTSQGSKVFASCGLDGSALLWDTRQTKPATVLKDDPNEGLTALAWQSGEENILAVGSLFGSIYLVDIRTCASLKKTYLFDRSIYRLLSIKPRLLAACADSHQVKVIDPTTEDLTVSYVDERHKDFVRGLSYDKISGSLISCGWDKQVLSHRLEP